MTQKSAINGSLHSEKYIKQSSMGERPHPSHLSQGIFVTLQVLLGIHILAQQLTKTTNTLNPINNSFEIQIFFNSNLLKKNGIIKTGSNN